MNEKRMKNHYETRRKPKEMAEKIIKLKVEMKSVKPELILNIEI